MVIGIIFSFFWTFVDSICFSSYTGLLMFRCWALEEVYRTRAAPRPLTSTTCSGQYWCLYSPNPCCRNTDWKSIHLGSGNGSTHQVHQHHDGPRAHTVSTYSLGTMRDPFWTCLGYWISAPAGRDLSRRRRQGQGFGQTPLKERRGPR